MDDDRLERRDRDPLIYIFRLPSERKNVDKSIESNDHIFVAPKPV